MKRERTPETFIVTENVHGRTFRRDLIHGSIEILWSLQQDETEPRRIVFETQFVRIVVSKMNTSNVIEYGIFDRNTYQIYKNIIYTYKGDRIYKVTVDFPGVQRHSVSGDLTVNGRFSRWVADPSLRLYPIAPSVMEELCRLYALEYDRSFADHRDDVLRDYTDIIQESYEMHQDFF